jgi:hypothetical protein
MYLEALIKLRSAKSMVEITNKVSSKYDECFTQICGAMNRGVPSDPSFIGLQKTSNEKEATAKMLSDSLKKISDEKGGNQKMQRGSSK